MKKLAFITLIIVLAIFYFQFNFNTKSDQYMIDDDYISKIDSLKVIHSNSDKEELAKAKIKAHLKSLNKKNSEFRNTLLTIADLDFESIELKNNCWTIVSSDPDAVMHLYYQYIDLKCLAKIGESFSISKDKVKELETAFQNMDKESLFVEITPRIKILTKPTSSCFTKVR